MLKIAMGFGVGVLVVLLVAADALAQACDCAASPPCCYVGQRNSDSALNIACNTITGGGSWKLASQGFTAIVYGPATRACCEAEVIRLLKGGAAAGSSIVPAGSPKDR